MKQARGSLLASVAGSLLYLGLAVLGRGWFAAFVSIPALTLVAVSTFGLVVVGLFSPVNLSPGGAGGPRQSLGSRRLDGSRLDGNRARECVSARLYGQDRFLAS
jgi:hypothetical protein